MANEIETAVREKLMPKPVAKPAAKEEDLLEKTED